MNTAILSNYPHVLFLHVYVLKQEEHIRVQCLHVAQYVHEYEEELASRIIESQLFAGERESLARTSCQYEIYRSPIYLPFPPLSHVP